MSQGPVPPLPPSSNSGAKGCIIGCAIVSVLGVLGCVLVGFAISKFFTGTVDAFTETEARPIPSVTMTDDEQSAITTKLEEFKAAVNGAENSEKEFSFTGQELNVLLRSNPDMAIFGDSVYATIEDGVIGGQVSLEFDKTPFVQIPLIGSALRGRFANGSATFSVFTENGRLYVHVEDFQVKGEQVTEEILAEFQRTNLADEAMTDPEFRQLMSNVDDIRVEGERLIVVLK